MNQGSNFPSESGTTKKITLILNALQGYLRHILSALKHPWQASRNIFQVSTLAPSTMSHAHHSPLRHGGSSLLTWFLSLFLAPGADLLSPQLDQIQKTVLRAGSLDGVKSLSPLLSATKVGRWQAGEKTLQVDFPSGDVSCQMARAPRHRQGTGRICRMAHSHFWRYRNYGGRDHIARFSSLSQLQAHSKGKEKRWYMESSLNSSSLLLTKTQENTSFEVSQIYVPGGSGTMKCFVCNASVNHHQFEGVGDLILPCEIW